MEGKFDPNALRKARIAKGWSRGDLVFALLGLEARLTAGAPVRLKRTLVAKWESGHRQPGFFYGSRLCLVFQLPAHQLGLNHLRHRSQFARTLRRLQTKLAGGLPSPTLVERSRAAERRDPATTVEYSNQATLESIVRDLSRQLSDQPNLLLARLASEYLKLAQAASSNGQNLRTSKVLRSLIGEGAVLLDTKNHHSGNSNKTTGYWQFMDEITQSPSVTHRQRLAIRDWLRGLGIIIAAWEGTRGLIASQDFLHLGREYFHAIEETLDCATLSTNDERSASLLASRLAIFLGDECFQACALDRAQEWWCIAAELASRSRDQTLQSYSLIEQSWSYMPVWGPTPDTELARSHLRLAQAVAPAGDFVLKATVQIRNAMLEAALYQETQGREAKRIAFDRALRGLDRAEKILCRASRSTQDFTTDLFRLLQPGELTGWKGSALVFLGAYSEGARLLSESLALIQRQPSRFHITKDLGHALIAGGRDYGNGLEYLQEALVHCQVSGNRLGAMGLRRRVTEAIQILRTRSNFGFLERELEEIRERAAALVC
jgi:hypothetical protein